MRIIDQFKKLQKNSKIALRLRKYQAEVFSGDGTLDFGVEILAQGNRGVTKEYEKFTLHTVQRQEAVGVVIRSKVDTEKELEVFAYLVEYVLFEMSKVEKASPSDIKRMVDDWLYFSLGKANEISVAKQVGLMGELFILKDLISNIPEVNHLNNWSGPEGAKVDYIFSENFGLEVKSRIQPFKDWVSISSVEQLDNELEGQHMAVCDYLPSDTGKTLKQVTEDVIKGFNDYDRANELIEKLRKAGYDYFREYSNLSKVNLFKLTIFNTKDSSFPVLPKPEDLRIDKIKYSINISELEAIDFDDTLAKVRSQLE